MKQSILQAHSPCPQRGSTRNGWGAPRAREIYPNTIIPHSVGSTDGPYAVGGPRRGRREQRQQDGWAQRISEKQNINLKRLDKMSDRLRGQLLDLDLDLDGIAGDDSAAARANSNAMASSNCSSSNLQRIRCRSKNASSTRRAGDECLRSKSFRAVPPSPEVLVALLRRAETKRSLLQELDICSPRAVASRMLLLSSLLDLSADRLAAMCRKCGRLLLRRPEQVQAGLAALMDCLEALMRAGTNGISNSSNVGHSAAPKSSSEETRNWESGSGGESTAAEAMAMARDMAEAAPELLLMPPHRLRRSGLELGAVCKARGIKVLPMLSIRPDLLLQSAASLAAKMDGLPRLLGLPPKRLREVLAARPDLLRRSPRQLAQRYQLLGQLCGVPPDFLAELIVQEPGVLGFGADTLRAKFEALAGQYGRFQDDVADMILVDPAVLIKAPPAAPSPAATGAAAGPKATNRRPGSAAAVVPVLDQMLQLSAASGIAMDAVLKIVVQDDRACSYSQETVAAQLAALAAALGLSSEVEARSRMAEHPGLLLLPADQLAGRVEALAQLLQPSPDSRSGEGKAGQSSALASPAMTLLQQQPELLLQAPDEVYSRLAQLGQMLLLGAAPSVAATADLTEPNTSLANGLTAQEKVAPSSLPPSPLPLPPRLLALVTSQPSLLTAPLEETADKLLVMQSLFEIPMALVLELISREPALLAMSADDLERKFRALAASFGAFSSDAIDVVFADPSLILRADTDSGLIPTPLQSRRQSQSSVTQSQWRAIPAANGGGNSEYGGGSGSGLPRASKSGTWRGAGDGSSGSSSAEAPSGQRRRQQQQQNGDAEQTAASRAFGSGSEQTGHEGKESESRRSSKSSQLPAPPPPPSPSQDLEFLMADLGGSFDVNGIGGSSSGVGVKGSKDMGLLGTMSAADFDRLGSEDLPPPPPSARRRRRLQQPE